MADTKKRRRTTNLGGRPRVRTGDEVQVTVEFPLKDYARLAGYVDHRKIEAIKNRESVAEQSKRKVLLRLWQDFWEDLTPKQKREVESGERFRREMQRPK